MKLGLHQSARLEQRLLQSPQMIQAMQVLQLPLVDLEARIEQELMENPFLELAERQDEDGSGDGPAEAAPETSRETARDETLEWIEHLEREYGDGRLGRARDPEESDRRHEALQNAPAEPRSLNEALLEQLALLDLDERAEALLEYLVWSLDDRGYLRTDPEDLLEELARDFQERGLEPAPTAEELELGLALLRHSSHPGLGARDLRDCLLLQLDATGEPEGLLRTLVTDHLEDLEHNRMPRIAKATGASMEEIKLALEDLRHLDPVPGAGFGEARATVITPEVVVEEHEGDYRVRLDRERVPELTLSKGYQRLLEQSKRGDGVREWIKKRYENANWFLDALKQRQSTLRLISEAVFRHQRGFLDKGVEGLVPLRMQEVADEIGVHISTVSRGVSGKYVQTPHGILPLKYFFTGGTTKDTGEETSQRAIQERLRALIDSEDKRKPLSDDQLAQQLAEAEGISIARRTVTKYRKALDIPSSSQRREY